MNLARVRGTVVATQRSDKVEGARWLLVEDCDQTGAGKGEYLVALDMVGADRGQLVLLTQGSSCRWTSRTDDRPMDTLVVAIVDTIDQGGAVLWPAADEAQKAPDAGKGAARGRKG
jgi:microcompartment protein CcmK/EutM